VIDIDKVSFYAIDVFFQQIMTIEQSCRCYRIADTLCTDTNLRPSLCNIQTETIPHPAEIDSQELLALRNPVAVSHLWNSRGFVY
jgi:hypothetical protein